MRAAVIREQGATPVVQEREPPTRGAGQALVRVLAASINPVDLAIASGRFYLDVPAPPYVPGAECVGVVVDSDALRAGTRVWCLAMTGGHAELALVPEERMVAVPDGLSDAMAAGLGVAGLAGWMPVLDRGELMPGESVLVLAASGVVGQVAVQAARHGGAGRIVAAARSAEGLERARTLGAHATVDLDGPDPAAALREACPDGVDLLIDPLWGPPFLQALPLMRARGRVVQVGNAAGQAAELPAGPLRGGRIDIRGFSVFSEDDVERAVAYKGLARASADGAVSIDVEVLALREAPAAWARVRAGADGRKLVLVP